MRQKTPAAAWRKLLGLAVLFFAGAAGLWAQNNEGRVDSEVARSDLLNRLRPARVTDQVSATAETTPGDEDLGELAILSETASHRALTLFGNISEFFTTDASLVEDGIGSDWFTLLQAGINYQPHLGGGLNGDLSFRQDLYRYARYAELSFNATNLGAGLSYILPQLGNLSLSARYGFTFLTNASATTQTYHEQFLSFGMQKPYQLTDAQSVFTGLNAQIVLEGSPGFALRDQFYWYAGYQAQLTRRLSASAFYQIGYIPFRESGRADWNQILSGAVTYSFLEVFSLSTSLSAAFNSSNDSFFDYAVLNLGAGITGTLRF